MNRLDGWKFTRNMAKNTLECPDTVTAEITQPIILPKTIKAVVVPETYVPGSRPRLPLKKFWSY